MRPLGSGAVSHSRILLGMTTTTTKKQQSRICHPGSQLPIVRRLVEDWTLLCRREENVTRCNSWGLPGKPVKNLDDVLVRAGFNTGFADSKGDGYLLMLVEHAKHDDLAARIVLQRILPPLLSIGYRRGRIVQGGASEAITDTLSHAWELIRTYPIERRPTKVASNLVRDAEYFAFVRTSRRQTLMFELRRSPDLERFAEPPRERTAKDEIDKVLSDAKELGLPQKYLEILRRLADGESYESIAKHHGVAVRTVRTWRHDGIIELRERMLCEA